MQIIEIMQGLLQTPWPDLSNICMFSKLRGRIYVSYLEFKDSVFPDRLHIGMLLQLNGVRTGMMNKRHCGRCRNTAL